MSGKVTTFLVCDDIRQESSGKTILIGVYATDIVISRFPVHINLSLWAIVEGFEMGNHPFTFNIKKADDEIVATANGVYTVKRPEIRGTIGVVSLILQLTKPGELIFAGKIGQSEEVEFLRLPVNTPPVSAPSKS